MKLPQILGILFCVAFLTGCRSLIGRQASAVDVSPGPSSSLDLYLDCRADQHKRILDFLQTHATITETAKIDYLLSSVRTSPLSYIRNGYEVTGDKAAMWLLWKMRHPQYENNPIDTADEFVERVADRSRKTGIPYYVIYPNGHRIEMMRLLSYELNALESAIKEKKLPSQSLPVSL